MNQNLLSRVLEFLRRKMWNKRWQRAVTCLAAVAVFGVTYALVLPAITMTNVHPTLFAEELSAWSGDELTVTVTAEAEEEGEAQTFVLKAAGEGADLSSSHAFNEEGICIITDEEGKEIELHRSIREDKENVVDYWFTLEPGTKTVFSLNLADEVDESRFAELVQAVKQDKEGSEDTAETASASDAGKSETAASAVKKSGATASNAAKATMSNADVKEANAAARNEEEKVVVEKDDDGFEQILDGVIVNDLEIEDEDDLQRTKVVASLKMSAGIGKDYEWAVKDAEKNADKRGDAELTFQWKDVVSILAEDTSLTAYPEGAEIAVFYDETACIPEGSSLYVEEYLPGSEVYEEHLKQAKAAVVSSVEDNAVKEVSHARLFDITILDPDGNKVEPAAPVKVIISYEEAVEVGDDSNFSVVHFKGDAPEVFSPGTLEGEEEVQALSFTTDSFSVYMVVGMETMKIQHISAEGDTYEIEVEYDKRAGIPADSRLNVEEIRSDEEIYKEYSEKTEKALGWKKGSASFMKLFDISVMSSAGEKVTLSGPVNVKIRLIGKADTAHTQVVHFGDKPEVLEAKAAGDTIGFETAGFSVYAFTEGQDLSGYAEKTATYEGYKVTVKYDAAAAQIPTDDTVTVEVAPAQNADSELEAVQGVLGENARFKIPALKIGLYKNGELQQPYSGSKVVVSISAEEDAAEGFYTNETVKVYSFTSSGSIDGEAVNATAGSDKTISFETDSFGDFGVAVNDFYTFRLFNLLDDKMYTGVEGEAVIPETIDVNMGEYGNLLKVSDFPNDYSDEYYVVAFRDSKDRAYDSGYTERYMGGATLKYYKPGTTSKYDAARAYAYRVVDGALQYATDAGCTTWETSKNNTICVLPAHKLVKFDPNLTDMSKATSPTFICSWTDQAGHSGDGEFYVQYKVNRPNSSNLNSGNLGQNYTYNVQDKTCFPNAPTMKNPVSPDETYVIFKKWRSKPQNWDAGGQTYLSQTTTSQACTRDNSSVIIWASDASANYHFLPLVTAMYDVRSINGQIDHQLPHYPIEVEQEDHTIELQYAPDEEGNPAGSIVASKTASWVDRDAGIGKIKINVGGVPVRTGADVILVMDVSGSMSNRYANCYVEREPFEKQGAMNVFDTLLSDPGDNNRVGITTFTGITGPCVPLQNSDGIQVLKTAINGMLTDGSNTHYELGLEKALEYLQNANSGAEADTNRWPNRPKYVIFMSDGVPNGNNSRVSAAISAIKELGTTVYSIGIEVVERDFNSHILPLATDADHAIRLTNVEQLTGVIQDIADTISAAAENAQFTDTMSEYFDALTAAQLAEYNEAHGTDYADTEGVTVSEDGQTVTISVGTLTGEDTPSHRREYEVYIKITDGQWAAVNESPRKTNTDIWLDYTDYHGNTDAKLDNTGDKIGSPVLGRNDNFIKVEYYRVDMEGNYLDEYGRILSDSAMDNARLREDTFGIDLEEGSEEYNVYYDTSEPQAYIDTATHTVYDKKPDGYILWPNADNPDHKAVTIHFEDDEPAKVVFKLYAPYTVSKEIIDKVETGYRKNEEIHYRINVTSTAQEDMFNVRMLDTVITPNDTTGYEENGKGTIRIEPNDNLELNDDGTVTIKTLLPNVPVTIDYYYKVHEDDVGKRVKNIAYVNGIATNVVWADTKGATIEKTVSDPPEGQSGFRTGDVAEYALAVKNIGSIAYDNILVTDVGEYITGSDQFTGKFHLKDGQPDVTFNEDTGEAVIHTSYISTDDGSTVNGLGIGKTFTFYLQYEVRPEDIGKSIKNTATVDDSTSEATIDTEVLKAAFKKIATGTTNGLGDAEFNLCGDLNGAADTNNVIITLKSVKDEEGIMKALSSGHTFTGDEGAYEEGDSVFKLATGTYWLIETKAPGGYELLDAPVQVTVGKDVSAMYKTSQLTPETDGLTYTFMVENSTGTELPSTGGPGTTLYTLGGILLLMSSALLYGFRMRHEERRCS